MRKNRSAFNFHLLVSSAVAVAHGYTLRASARVRGDSLVWLGQLFAQRLGDRPRNSRSEIDLIECVAVPLEEPDRAVAQSENLIAVGRLQKPPERLGVEAVGRDGHFDDGPLKSEYMKKPRCAEHGQSFQCVIPEFLILGERLKRFQKQPNLRDRIFLAQRPLQLFYKVPKSNRILLIAGMMSMRRLVK